MKLERTEWVGHVERIEDDECSIFVGKYEKRRLCVIMAPRGEGLEETRFDLVEWIQLATGRFL
jgi:hypothetical protein